MKIHPAKTIRGRISVPGDKSISHRAAIIASLAEGRSTVHNFSTSADCASTIECLRGLGVHISKRHEWLEVNGAGLAGYEKPQASLDCGNSGTTMRMLAGVLAGNGFASTLIGDHSLSSRPMKRVVEPLSSMGASIISNEGKPPLTINGTTELRPIEYTAPIASAQVKSAILLAGLHAQGSTSVTELQQTRDHTERMLQFFGAAIEIQNCAKDRIRIAVHGCEPLAASEVLVPGDISSAAFFIAAATLFPDSTVEILNVGLNPTRTQFLSTLRSLGLNVTYVVERQASNEPVGRVIAKGEQLSEPTANAIPAEVVPQLIDELPLLAVIGARLPGGITVRGASELRYKETDRIATTIANLKAMGVDAKEFADGFSVRGSQTLHGAQLNSYGDHRIAMAFAVAALTATEECELLDPQCVGISFPEFFNALDGIVQR